MFPAPFWSDITVVYTFIASCECDCAGTIVMLTTGSFRTQDDALAALLEVIRKRHANIIFDKQGWRCAECGRIRPLQHHHVKPRSKGRDDRVSNGVGLCEECHERTTNPRHGAAGGRDLL